MESVTRRAFVDRREGARRLAILAVGVTGIWLLLGVFLGFQVYLNASHGERPIALGQALEISFRRYLIYAGLTFPILWLCRRFPLESGRFRRFAVVHAGGVTAFIVLNAALRLVTGSAVNPVTLERAPVSLETGMALARSNIFEQFWMYASIVGVVLAVRYYRRYRERELQEAELRRRVAEYELQILKLQLHPHFLFNTLNGISALMTKDVAAARGMLVRLSELLRLALAHTSAREVSLKEELEFLEAYVEIERMRLGERLRVAYSIDPDTLDAGVPNMILQPLVENAIRHGVAALRSGGAVELSSSRVEGRLRILIGNDGPPLAPAGRGATGFGMGLGNTQARLQQLYGDGFELRFSDRIRGGVELRMEIPFHAVPPSRGEPA